MYKKEFILMNQFIYFSQEEQELEKHLLSKLQYRDCNLLSMHYKNIKSDPLKSKALLIAFIGKAAFNIGGTTIHSALHIPINQSLSNLNKLSTKTLSKLTEQYEQLQFIVIVEISLVGARLLNAINQRLCSIKHLQIFFLEV